MANFRPLVIDAGMVRQSVDADTLLVGDVTNAGTTTAAHLKDTSLTSGRVAYVTTGGQLTDSANLTYDTTKVAITNGGLQVQSGNMAINATPSAFNAAAEEICFYSARTFTDAVTPSVTKAGFFTTIQWNPGTGGGSVTQYVIGFGFDVYTTPTETVNNTGYMASIKGSSLHRSGSTISTVYGINMTFGTCNGVSDSTGTITNCYGIMLNGQKTASSTITNNYGLYVTGVAGSTAYDIYAADTGALNYFGGKVGFGAGTPTALAHFKAGTATAGTAPIKLTTGTLLASAEAGTIEFVNDDLYFTITSAAARQKVALTAGLTSGRVPYATTNGRLTDSGNLVFNGSNLGINAAASYPLNVYQAVTDWGNLYLSNFKYNTAVTLDGTNYSVCQYVDSTVQGVSAGVTDSGYRCAFRADVFSSNANLAGTVATQYAVQGRAGINVATAGAVVNTAYAGHFSILNSVAGTTIGTAYGVYIDNSAATGTITNRYGLYQVGAAAKNYFQGPLGCGTNAPTALLHIKAGTATANTAPIKLTSGTLLSAAEVGVVEFLTDDLYFTITTGAARQKIALTTGLTSGRLPYSTTNGRLTDSANLTYDGASLTMQANATLYQRIISASSLNGWTYPYIRMDRARGTTTSPSSVLAGDVVGGLNFYGYQDSDYAGVGGVVTYVDAVVVTYNRGYMTFLVADGTVGSANVTVASAYYDRFRFYKFAHVDKSAVVGVTESLRLCYKNAIDAGTQITAWAGDSVTQTGLIEHKLLAGAKSYWAFSTFTGAALAEKFRVDGDGLTTVTGTLKVTGLTSGRVPYATTAGLLTDSANFTYDGALHLTADASAVSMYLPTGNALFRCTTAVSTNAGYIDFPRLYFRDNGNSYAYALSIVNGQVAIAGATPSDTLDVYGRLAAGSSSLVLRNGGLADGSDSLTQIRLGYHNQNQYQQYIASRHGNVAANNAIDFYTGDGTQAGVFPTNAIHGLTITNGKVGIGTNAPTAALHLKAGTITASTAPIKLTSGALLSSAEIGAVEFSIDDLYFTITSSTARQKVVLTAALTSGRVPFATTNGRLTDSANLTSDGTNLTAAGIVQAAGFSVGATAGIDATPTIKDGDGSSYHHFTFTKGILTAYVKNTTP